MKIRSQILPTSWLVLPPLIAILASLWPLEYNLLALVCLPLLGICLMGMLAAQSLRQRLFGLGAILLIGATITVNIPLQTAFRVYRPELDQIAQRVAAGNVVSTPFWVGPIRVCKAEQNSKGVVCLWTNDDPNGRTGFVQHKPSQLPFNLWSHMVLNDKWQFISED